MTEPSNAPAALPAYQARRPAQLQQLTLRGNVTYQVRSWGEPSGCSAERPPLLLAHGWMDVGASFQFTVDAMAADRYIVALDWRGFGGSSAPPSDSYWFPDYLGDLDALLDALFPSPFLGQLPGQRIDLLGHSMGGNVAMSYAGVRPERIRKLVNLEGFGMPDAPAEMAPARLATWLDELKTPQTLRSYASLADVAARLCQNNPRLAPARAAWLAPHWAALGNDQHWHILGDPAHKRVNPALYRRSEALACWARITAPVLWLEGADTGVLRRWGERYPRSDVESRLAVVPRLERGVFQDCGHMLHFDQPEALAQRLDAFLDT